MIILYGLDEKSSIPYASLLIQKGYDNIFMLNGGIEEFVNTYPEHCEGPMVDKLIAQKMMNDALRKQELAQKTTSKSFKTSLKTNTNDGLNSNKVISSNQSQYSGLSSNTKTTISTLKKNLKK